MTNSKDLNSSQKFQTITPNMQTLDTIAVTTKICITPVEKT